MNKFQILRNYSLSQASIHMHVLESLACSQKVCIIINNNINTRICLYALFMIAMIIGKVKAAISGYIH